MTPPSRRAGAALVCAAVAAVSLVACSAPAGAGDGEVTITYSTDSGVADVAISKAMIPAFEKAEPGVTVKMTTRPNGLDGDNQLKTQLATGEAPNVFISFSGSQLQGLNPDRTMVPLSEEPWADAVSDDFRTAASGKDGLYGAPIGTSFAGGVMYNTKVYADLGLSVPTTWAEFLSNSEKIKAAGDVTPILQTFGDTWTSQLFVLADFANVSAQAPGWAADFTANDPGAKYAKAPGLTGFQHTAEVFQKDLVNEDAPALLNVDGLKELAEGRAAQYPMITNVLPNIEQASPGKLDDIGFFALPAEQASDTRMTLWEPAGLFITKDTEGAELAAAKKLVAFVNSAEGCRIQAEALTPTGPFATSACELPADVPGLVQDEQAYVDAEQSGLALEFISPVKGPNLEKILIGVANGTTTAEQGAQLYDQDVEKQAQQLGLKGW